MSGNFTNGKTDDTLKTDTPALREEAVKLILMQSLTLEDATVRLTIPKGRWPTAWWLKQACPLLTVHLIVMATGGGGRPTFLLAMQVTLVDVVHLSPAVLLLNG